MTTTLVTTIARRGGRDHVFARLVRHPLGAPSILFLALVAVVAVAAPWLVPMDPTATDVQNVFGPPGDGHPLGTDSAGRDVLSRLIIGTTYSLAGGLVVAIVAAVIGVTGGLIAGYFSGWTDTAASWLTSLTMSLPGMVVLLAARAAFGPSMWLTMALFGAIISPTYYRVVYNSVRAVRNELFIDAARTSGLTTPAIIGRHVLTAVRAPIILLTSGIIAGGIGMMAALDFLGLGSPDTPTWGQMLSEGFYQLTRAPQLVLWPALALGLTMIALVLLGTALRDELEGSHGSAKGARTAWHAERAPEKAIAHDDGQGDPILEIADLAVAYPGDEGWKTVVHDANLTVRRGEVHGLIGESGSGKSQTAFAVLGLLATGGRVVHGSIRFDGQDVASLSPRDMNRLRGSRIAYVPQEPMSNLDPAFTVGDQFTDPLRIVHGMSKAEAKKKALDLLATVGIPDPERTFRAYPHQLSGGMAQRVLIAAAVATEPDLLIADEPTTALDVTVQAEVLDLLRDLREAIGMSVLIVTHSFGVVADVCDHVSVMQHGAIVETGPCRSVFADPRHEYTQRLFASVPRGEPRGSLREGTAS
ncbi:dipeptide/oligopeptide/nickel ABC transporter permease/ATP-binding protein [Microbacterium sp. G2-8]|uniref:dipeptide/oligopeptide/nickel ABC transporter permease/ATP-binding protein n=1 Tax=Microbacterium sp. G2-8 TaxID=2842454 RepID=UPI001C897B3A|nr:dipeptide/oligopeptide/nickel ABC transporter permease/ATP-binding protein [Microbacterium sp. G2-8]